MIPAPLPKWFVEKKKESWQYRACAKSGWNKSRLGCIVMAVVGTTPATAPMISMARGAVISTDGMVIADMMLEYQLSYRATVLGDVIEIRDNFRRLADVLKLTDAERLEMFVALNKWMGTDLRARAAGKDNLQ